jgi:glycosyltransferase involved in cell wall biosynthesis
MVQGMVPFGREIDDEPLARLHYGNSTSRLRRSRSAAMTVRRLLGRWRRSSIRAPAVSVIIPVYNKAAVLPGCLQSVQNQSLRDLEIIVVDDCSQDQSRDVLAQAARVDPRIRVVVNKQNLGAARARNRGLVKATGRFVQFTDADDILPQDALKTLLNLAMDECCDVVRGQIKNLAHDVLPAGPIDRSIPECHGCTLKEIPALWIVWGHTTCLISRDLLMRHAIRYPDLRDGEDPVLMAHVLTKAERISVTPDITYLYRPSEKFVRPGLDCLHDIKTHARLTRDILVSYHAPCWTNGYGPFLRETYKMHIKSMVHAHFAGLDPHVAQDMIGAIDEITAGVENWHPIFANAQLWAEGEIDARGLAFPNGRDARPDCSRFSISFAPAARPQCHANGLRITVSVRTICGVKARHLKVSFQGVDHIVEVQEVSQDFSLDFPSPASRLQPLQIQFEVLGLAEDAEVAFSSDIVGLILERFEVSSSAAA